jgi:hypothetical protein
MQIGDARRTRSVSPDEWGKAVATLATTAVKAAESLCLRM